MDASDERFVLRPVAYVRSKPVDGTPVVDVKVLLASESATPRAE